MDPRRCQSQQRLGATQHSRGVARHPTFIQKSPLASFEDTHNYLPNANRTGLALCTGLWRSTGLLNWNGFPGVRNLEFSRAHHDGLSQPPAGIIVPRKHGPSRRGRWLQGTLETLHHSSIGLQFRWENFNRTQFWDKLPDATTYLEFSWLGS